MKEKVLLDLERSRRYTLDLFHLMPPESFDFKPTEGVWTFREQMHHIGYGMLWIEANYLRKSKMDWEPPIVPKDRLSVLDYIQKAHDTVHLAITSMQKLDDDAIRAFYLIMDHSAHHRGQVIIYLRCKNMSPPEYPL